jgi:hypothetical protein
MPANYDLTTDVGKVRLLIPDRNIDDPVFQDEELQFFLDNNGSVRYAAAAALEVAATDDVMTFKVMKSGSDSVDATKGAKLLLERATRLRSPDPLISFVGEIGVVEMSNGVFGRRQLLRNVIRRAT